MRKALAALALLPAGCGSIFSPGPDLVPVDSDPQGAVIRVDGDEVGRTPMTVPVPRNGERTIRVEAAGFDPYEKKLEKSFNPWSGVNVIGFVSVVGLVAWAIDSSTGNLYVSDTAPVFVTLQPIAPQ